MNTNNLKRFAKEARIKLLDQVGRKLEFVLTHDTAELRGKQKEIEQLKKKIAEQGKEQVIEMVSYTWFNRLMALRFMDANGYTIPKVITPLEGMTNPEVLQNALGGNIEPELKLDHQRLNDLLDGKTAATDAHTEAYKMLLVASCNQWHTAMPFMFERISDYTELLLPDDLLSDYSIVADIRNGMSDEDCQQEELIGWLYQFYIADKKDEVFDGLKKNIKITAENIPAATQLFTPRWIVRYMVENTLGKLWLTLKPNSKLRQFMPYYIEAPEGNAPALLPEGIKGVTDITFLDPCQGSGHVLVYAFDLFTKIYEEEGYNTNEIPALILEHNLFGIDIDERAAQLAAFALTMKARSYYPRFLRKPVQPHVIALENVNEDIIKQAVKLPLAVAGKLVYDNRDLTLYNLTQADNFGSLIQIDPEELKALQIQKGSIWQEQEQKLKEQAECLSRKYHCVVTNPPYMGQKGMNDFLKQLLSEKYSIGKTDLFSAFILRCQDFISLNGYSGMVTMESWMFLSSFEELRKFIIDNTSIQSLSHFGWHVMRIAFGTCSFILQKSNPNENKGVYSYTEIDNIDRVKEIPTVFPITNNGRYNTINQIEFEKIPGSPIGYWLSKRFIESFSKFPILRSISKPFQGMSSSNNVRFLRFWFEIDFGNFKDDCINDKASIESKKKWFPYNKGGSFRKWYGNYDYVVNWFNSGQEVKEFTSKLPQGTAVRIKSYEHYFKKSITWSALTAGTFGSRYSDKGAIFDVSGSSVFPDETNSLFILGVLNSNYTKEVLKVLNPTLNYQVIDISRIPVNVFSSEKERINSLIKNLIEEFKHEWDLRETSWDFKENGLIKLKNNQLSTALKEFILNWSNIFHKLHNSEVELNSLFLQIYELQDELKPDVPFEEITILQEESKIINGELFIDPIPVLLQLLSYSIGCIFGRYSIDKPGLILANQGETIQDFLKQIPSPTFMPDEDNIIPVLEGEWFTDDIVGRFKVFLKAAFGEVHFEENLKYIEETISKDIRKYFVKDFYNDHIKRYKKRPIYWMFSSPKGHFKALIYMHRYQPDLCSKMLNDYLQAFISKLEAAKQTQTMLSLREDISAREKTVAVKEIDKYEAMLKDCLEYEKTLFTIATQKISIDLDDGVKVSYQKFKDVLVPIKGLEKEEE
ncbi:MAG: BREX-1 system adenine-specific DNA-methyltransferase PglX [Chitinophagaceae bacterium]|nr:BREX-1 system adenine-specific DNA-methyltransferase PglX [Chitinophagaceae bacterium]